MVIYLCTGTPEVSKGHSYNRKQNIALTVTQAQEDRRGHKVFRGQYDNRSDTLSTKEQDLQTEAQGSQWDTRTKVYPQLQCTCNNTADTSEEKK